MITTDATTPPPAEVTLEPSAGMPVTSEQHRLAWSVLLHLLPGAALTVFIVLAAPAARAMGFPAVFALFVGIPLVIVPIELGFLPLSWLAWRRRSTQLAMATHVTINLVFLSGLAALALGQA